MGWMVLTQFGSKGVGMSELGKSRGNQAAAAQLLARADRECRDRLGDRLLILHPLAEGATDHDLLPIRFDILQPHARVALQLALSARQHHTELLHKEVWRGTA